MARFRIHPLVEDDVADVLAYTLERFGLGQVHRYEQIIEEALTRLIEHPESGRALKIRAGFFLYSIERRGRRASHQFLYRVLEDGRVEVLRLLHDSMDVARHIPRDIGED
jgi:toxin ParE1/3/4